MNLDSWEGNFAVKKLAEKYGFQLIDSFPDEVKRGPGGITNVYEKRLR